MAEVGSMAVPPARSSKYSTDFPDGDPDSRPTTVPFFTASPCFTRNVSRRPYTEKSPPPCCTISTFPNPETAPANATSPCPTDFTDAPEGASISTPRFSIVTSKVVSCWRPKRVTTFPASGAESPPESNANRRGASAGSLAAAPPPRPPPPASFPLLHLPLDPGDDGLHPGDLRPEGFQLLLLALLLPLDAGQAPPLLPLSRQERIAHLLLPGHRPPGDGDLPLDPGEFLLFPLPGPGDPGDTLRVRREVDAHEVPFPFPGGRVPGIPRSGPLPGEGDDLRPLEVGPSLPVLRLEFPHRLLRPLQPLVQGRDLPVDPGEQASLARKEPLHLADASLRELLFPERLGQLQDRLLLTLLHLEETAPLLAKFARDILRRRRSRREEDPERHRRGEERVKDPAGSPSHF